MTRRARGPLGLGLVTLVALTAGCGEDVFLGQSERPGPDGAGSPDAVAIDAALPGSDAASAAFWPGPYDLTFGGRDVMCDGTLVGMEPSFDVVTVEGVAFIAGEIELVVLGPDTIRLDGPALLTGFGSEALVLQRGIIDAPPELFVASAPRGGEPGPASTTFAAVLLVIDVSSASGRGVVGQAFALFEDTAGTCSVSFSVSLVPLAAT